MRQTIITGDSSLSQSVTIQNKLDKFWALIEDRYEEDWRQEYNGDQTLEVDDAMLERILNDNVATAWYSFGAHKGGQKADGTRFFLSRPEYLKGTYTVRGTHTANGHFITPANQKREYFFVQEGY